MQALAIGGGQGAQLVVAVQEVADGAQGDDDASARQLLVDLGDAAMLSVAEAPDQGQDIEAELVVRQGQEGLGFRAIRAMVARTVGVGTAANTQGKARNGVEGDDRAVFAAGGPKEMTTLRAVSGNGRENLGLRGTRPATGARHGSPSSCTSPPLFYGWPRPKFASVVFFRTIRRE